MSKKVIFSLLTALIVSLPILIVSLPVFGAENEIKLRKNGTHTGSRTEVTVSATIDEQVFTVLFSDVPASCIAVYSVSTPNIQNYAPAYSAQADLTSVPAGEYVVEIYAFDKWWTEYFEIE
jgi:hypothetical protein